MKEPICIFLFFLIMYIIFFYECTFLENFSSKKTSKKKKRTFPCRLCGQELNSDKERRKHEKDECEERPYKPKYENTKSFGGSGGNSFRFICPPPDKYSDDMNYITQFYGRGGSEIDQIQITCADGTSSETYGGNGGNEFNFKENDQGYNNISGRGGSRIDKIKIDDEEYGGNGGSEFNLTCTKGKIVGIYGKSGNRLDNFGVICDRNISDEKN